MLFDCAMHLISVSVYKCDSQFLMQLRLPPAWAVVVVARDDVLSIFHHTI